MEIIPYNFVQYCTKLPTLVITEKLDLYVAGERNQLTKTVRSVEK